MDLSSYAGVFPGWHSRQHDFQPQQQQLINVQQEALQPVVPYYGACQPASGLLAVAPQQPFQQEYSAHQPTAPATTATQPIPGDGWPDNSELTAFNSFPQQYSMQTSNGWGAGPQQVLNMQDMAPTGGICNHHLSQHAQPGAPAFRTQHPAAVRQMHSQYLQQAVQHRQQTCMQLQHPAAAVSVLEAATIGSMSSQLSAAQIVHQPSVAAGNDCQPPGLAIAAAANAPAAVQQPESTAQQRPSTDAAGYSASMQHSPMPKSSSTPPSPASDIMHGLLSSLQKHLRPPLHHSISLTCLPATADEPFLGSAGFEFDDSAVPADSCVLMRKNSMLASAPGVEPVAAVAPAYTASDSQACVWQQSSAGVCATTKPAAAGTLAACGQLPASEGTLDVGASAYVWQVNQALANANPLQQALSTKISTGFTTAAPLATGKKLALQQQQQAQILKPSPTDKLLEGCSQAPGQQPQSLPWTIVRTVTTEAAGSTPSPPTAAAAEQHPPSVVAPAALTPAATVTISTSPQHQPQQQPAAAAAESSRGPRRFGLDLSRAASEDADHIMMAMALLEGLGGGISGSNSRCKKVTVTAQAVSASVPAAGSAPSSKAAGCPAAVASKPQHTKPKPKLDLSGSPPGTTTAPTLKQPTYVVTTLAGATAVQHTVAMIELQQPDDAQAVQVQAAAETDPVRITYRTAMISGRGPSTAGQLGNPARAAPGPAAVVQPTSTVAAELSGSAQPATVPVKPCVPGDKQLTMPDSAKGLPSAAVARMPSKYAANSSNHPGTAATAAGFAAPVGRQHEQQIQAPSATARCLQLQPVAQQTAEARGTTELVQVESPGILQSQQLRLAASSISAQHTTAHSAQRREQGPQTLHAKQQHASSAARIMAGGDAAVGSGADTRTETDAAADAALDAAMQKALLAMTLKRQQASAAMQGAVDAGTAASTTAIIHQPHAKWSCSVLHPAATYPPSANLLGLSSDAAKHLNAAAGAGNGPQAALAAAPTRPPCMSPAFITSAEDSSRRFALQPGALAGFHTSWTQSLHQQQQSQQQEQVPANGDAGTGWQGCSSNLELPSTSPPQQQQQQALSIVHSSHGVSQAGGVGDQLQGYVMDAGQPDKPAGVLEPTHKHDSHGHQQKLERLPGLLCTSSAPQDASAHLNTGAAAAAAITMSAGKSGSSRARGRKQQQQQRQHQNPMAAPMSEPVPAAGPLQPGSALRRVAAANSDGHAATSSGAGVIVNSALEHRQQQQQQPYTLSDNEACMAAAAAAFLEGYNAAASGSLDQSWQYGLGWSDIQGQQQQLYPSNWDELAAYMPWEPAAMTSNVPAAAGHDQPDQLDLQQLLSRSMSPIVVQSRYPAAAAVAEAQGGGLGCPAAMAVQQHHGSSNQQQQHTLAVPSDQEYHTPDGQQQQHQEQFGDVVWQSKPPISISSDTSNDSCPILLDTNEHHVQVAAHPVQIPCNTAAAAAVMSANQAAATATEVFAALEALPTAESELALITAAQTAVSNQGFVAVAPGLSQSVAPSSAKQPPGVAADSPSKHAEHMPEPTVQSTSIPQLVTSADRAAARMRFRPCADINGIVTGAAYASNAVSAAGCERAAAGLEVSGSSKAATAGAADSIEHRLQPLKAVVPTVASAAGIAAIIGTVAPAAADSGLAGTAAAEMSLASSKVVAATSTAPAVLHIPSGLAGSSKGRQVNSSSTATITAAGQHAARTSVARMDTTGMAGSTVGYKTSQLAAGQQSKDPISAPASSTAAASPTPTSQAAAANSTYVAAVAPTAIFSGKPLPKSSRPAAAAAAAAAAACVKTAAAVPSPAKEAAAVTSRPRAMLSNQKPMPAAVCLSASTSPAITPYTLAPDVHAPTAVGKAAEATVPTTATATQKLATVAPGLGGAGSMQKDDNSSNIMHSPTLTNAGMAAGFEGIFTATRPDSMPLAPSESAKSPCPAAAAAATPTIAVAVATAGSSGPKQKPCQLQLGELASTSVSTAANLPAAAIAYTAAPAACQERRTAAAAAAAAETAKEDAAATLLRIALGLGLKQGVKVSNGASSSSMLRKIGGPVLADAIGASSSTTFIGVDGAGAGAASTVGQLQPRRGLSVRKVGEAAAAQQRKTVDKQSEVLGEVSGSKQQTAVLQDRTNVVGNTVQTAKPAAAVVKAVAGCILPGQSVAKENVPPAGKTHVSAEDAKVEAAAAAALMAKAAEAAEVAVQDEAAKLQSSGSTLTEQPSKSEAATAHSELEQPNNSKPCQAALACDEQQSAAGHGGHWLDPKAADVSDAVAATAPRQLASSSAAAAGAPAVTDMQSCSLEHSQATAVAAAGHGSVGNLGASKKRQQQELESEQQQSQQSGGEQEQKRARSFRRGQALRNATAAAAAPHMRQRLRTYATRGRPRTAVQLAAEDSSKAGESAAAAAGAAAAPGASQPHIAAKDPSQPTAAVMLKDVRAATSAAAPEVASAAAAAAKRVGDVINNSAAAGKPPPAAGRRRSAPALNLSQLQAAPEERQRSAAAAADPGKPCDRKTAVSSDVPTGTGLAKVAAAATTAAAKENVGMESRSAAAGRPPLAARRRRSAPTAAAAAALGQAARPSSAPAAKRPTRSVAATSAAAAAVGCKRDRQLDSDSSSVSSESESITDSDSESDYSEDTDSDELPVSPVKRPRRTSTTSAPAAAPAAIGGSSSRATGSRAGGSQGGHSESARVIANRLSAARSYARRKEELQRLTEENEKAEAVIASMEAELLKMHEETRLHQRLQSLLQRHAAGGPCPHSHVEKAVAEVMGQ